LRVERLARFAAFLVIAMGAGFAALVADACEVQIPGEGFAVLGHGFAPSHMRNY
jgi:hypothetical protein